MIGLNELWQLIPLAYDWSRCREKVGDMGSSSGK